MSPLGRKTKRSALQVKKHCVEHFRDVDDWMLGLMVNEFVITP